MIRNAYLLSAIGGICLVFAALRVAFTGFDIGPAWAWAFGGIGAWALGWAAAHRPSP